MSVPPNPDFGLARDRADAMPADPEQAAPADDTLPPRPASPTANYASAGPAETATLPPSLRVAAPAPASVHLPGYEIVGELGRGGMGVVYKARQVGLNRTVALKMILAGGHASAGDLDRFRTEAEAVARLLHPNIVQVYETGTHAGLPYFSLEFCPGGSLDRKLDGTPWEPAPAAALVETLSRAIQHAHEHGIVHRDLKPANVLLAADGTPKITDFGLAKRLDSTQARTQAGAILGTPSYMAPEQAGTAEAVGPPADTYALGAVLYQLLTGRPPFKAAADFDTIMQVVEQEPVPPTRLNPKTPRDLETICLKCLAKEPARRYVRSEALAEDLRRFQANEPIVARPAGRLERGWRWCRRNPALAGSLAAIALALVLGAAVSTAFGVRANRNAERADREASAAVAARNRTREALDAMVSGVTGDSLATQTVLSEEQKRFLQSVLTYYKEFAAEPGEDREGRWRLANAHYRLGMIRARLGQPEEGASVFRRSAELYDRLATDHPGVLDYRRGLARSHNSLGNVMASLGQPAEAEAAYRAALAVQEALARDHPGVPDYLSDLAGSQNNLGPLLADLGRRAEAEASFRAALAVREALAGDHPGVPNYRRDLAGSHNNLGALLARLGRRAEAEAAFRAALAVREALARDHPGVPDYRRDLAQSHISLGNSMASLGRRAEAEAAYRAALAILEPLARDHPGVPDYRRDLAQSHNSLGRLLAGLGRRAEAEAAFRTALADRVALARDHPGVPDYRRDLAQSHNSLGLLLAGLGRRAEAEAAYRAALALQDGLARDHPGVPNYRRDLAQSHNSLGLLLAGLGRRAEAEATYRAALALQEALARDHPGVPEFVLGLGGTYVNFGYLLLKSGDSAAGLDWYRKGVETLEPVYRADPRLVDARKFLRNAHWGRARYLSIIRRHADAQADWDRALELTDDAGEKIVIRLARAANTVRAGDPAAAAEVEAVLSAAPALPERLYDAVCVLALASATVKDDATLADRHAARAVVLLRQAFAKGYTNVTHMLQDADLDSLRLRPDYIELLWDLADGQMHAK
jgi:serine/threonine-protein kinase